MRRISRAIGWIGNYQAVSTVLQSELLRIYLWPWVSAAMTGGAGIWGQVPAMWIIMASTVSFAAVSHGMLRFSEYRERKDPLNKVKYIGTHMSADLTTPITGRSRELTLAQVQIDIQNEASFPLSFILESADTQIAGRTPPRSVFPKPAMRILQGATIRVVDDPIDCRGIACGPLEGKMSFKIRYGLPGKERYRLDLDGNLMVTMNPDGMIQRIVTSWT